MTGNAYDVVVLGAGPGGYVAAIRAAQLGLKVAVVERDRAGGVCLNWGCIPSKAILTSAELYDEVARHGAEHGLLVDGLHLDYERVIARRRQVVNRLVKGVESLFKRNAITVVNGHGRLVAPDRMAVGPDGGVKILEARHIILATGSRERMLPGLEIDGETVMTSRQALESTRRPESVVIIGGGPIGIEFAYAWACFGSAVTIIEMEDRLLPGSEPEIAEELKRQLRRRGVTSLTKTRFTSLSRRGAHASVEVVGEDAESRQLEADTVLVAVGREALSGGIGLEDAGVRMAGGFVEVGPDLRTSIPSVFAIGDLVGPPLLAHKASAEGVLAAENIADGGARTIDYASMPACVYCQPEVASIGLTEEQARRRGKAVRVGKLPFRAIGKAVATGHQDGLVKIVADDSNGELLGCHIMGKGATDLIAEVAVAMKLGATTTAVGETVHAHPTLSEAIMEACLAAEGKAVNH